MSPFFFGTSKRRLFGVYHAAHTSKATVRAVVLCQPWAHEYIYAHRSMVRLANSLADSGYHVLRFDYFGTGDSAGDSTDVTLKGCRDDIRMAVEELLDISGGDRVSLIGLRLGGALAAEVMKDDPSLIDRLVLWDPVVLGLEYIDALYHSAANMPIGKAAPPERPASDGGGHEICGFPLTDEQRGEIQQIDLTVFASKISPKTTTIVTHPTAAHDRLVAALGHEDNSDANFEHVPDCAAWHEDWPQNAGMIPVEAIRRIGARMT